MKIKDSSILPRLSIIALITLLSTASLLAGVTAGASPKSYTVRIGGHFGSYDAMSFEPRVLVIQQGDKVTWNNIEGPHTVTSVDLVAVRPLFDSSPRVNFTKVAIEQPAILAALADFLEPGESYRLDTGALDPGAYFYICKIHPGMEGWLIVTEGGTPSAETVVAGYAPAEDVSFWAFIPRNVTVPKGSTVTWISLELFEPHTVSSAAVADGQLTLTGVFESSPLVPFPPEPLFAETGWAGPPFTGGLLLPAPYPFNSYTYTFNEVGTYVYYCKLHAANIGGTLRGMVGTIVVLPKSATPEELAALQSKLTSAEGKLTTAEGTIRSLSEKLTTAEGKLTAAEGNVKSLSDKSTAAEGTIKTLQGQLSTAQDAVTKLSGTVSALNSQLGTMTNLAAASLVLALIAIGLAVWASRKRS